MRTVTCDGIGPVSALGFGCASLGSRIAPKVGRAAIERALQAGITWFDVAPSYGDGKAEEILGQALKGTDATIVTKVGLVAPRSGLAKRVVGAVARPVVRALPGLRPLVKRLKPDAAQRLPLDGETIRISILQSLERLGRQSVGVLALHDPTIEDVQRDDVIRALSDIREQGLAARIAVAGTVTVFEAARAAGLPADIAQFGNSPFTPQTARLSAPKPFTVTHSVFGVSGALARLNRMVGQPEGKRQSASFGYDKAADLLLGYAFAANPDGVVIASSYNPSHLAANVAAASKDPAVADAPKIETWLANAA